MKNGVPDGVNQTDELQLNVGSRKRKLLNRERRFVILVLLVQCVDNTLTAKVADDACFGTNLLKKFIPWSCGKG